MVMPVASAENRFVLAWKMFHPIHEMSRAFNGRGNGNGHEANGLLQQPKKKTANPPAGASSSEARESRVMFQTHDGLELRGILVRLTRHVVVFEIYEPAPVLRLSEVLNKFKIVVGIRTVYLGRVVISGLVNTGIQVVCEAKFDELGPETAFFLQPLEVDCNLEQAYDQFFKTWQNNYRISTEFKALIVDVEAFLIGTKQWLEQIEFSLGKHVDGGLAEREQVILDSVSSKVIAAFNVQHERFEELVYALSPELRGVHQDFVRQHWHRLFLCSPFGHRTYYKPIGYAGDYKMMSMIHRNQPEGRSLYEKLIHYLLVSQWPAQSVRCRVTHLGENIANETLRVTRSKRRIRILNVGCGPAWEIQDFLRGNLLSNRADFTLMDFNEETLIHANGELTALKRQFARRAGVQTQKVSVHDLLRHAQQEKTAREGGYDMIYCAGLFDYLSTQTCRALIELWHDWLSPGGLMIIANMNDTKPFRNFIEFILDWQLIYRDSDDMLSLVPGKALDATEVIMEKTTVNLFLHIRKPD
jgi:extracellular factor (EF) 3-hydroxypalmitic acid methyl ester biosynthesis protein